MSDETHNGWTNYETWAAYNWLSNDEESYRECRRLCRFCSDYESAENLRRYVVEGLPDLENGLAADLLNASVSEINWSELAMAMK